MKLCGFLARWKHAPIIKSVKEFTQRILVYLFVLKSGHLVDVVFLSAKVKIENKGDVGSVLCLLV